MPDSSGREATHAYEPQTGTTKGACAMCGEGVRQHDAGREATCSTCGRDVLPERGAVCPYCPSGRKTTPDEQHARAREWWKHLPTDERVALWQASEGREATPREDRPMSAIDSAATALCNADGQRHLRLERRDGTPCRSHARDAWTAVEAVQVLLQGQVGTADDAPAHGEAQAVLRQIYGLLTAPPEVAR